MHTFLSVAAALALAAGPASAPPSDDGAMVVAPVTVGAPAAAAPAAPTPAAPPEAAPAAAPAPAPAKPAGPLKVAIIPLDAPAELLLVGRSLSEAIAQEAAKGGDLEVVAPAAVLSRLGPEAAALATQCGEAAACYAGPAARLGVDRVVGGRLDRVGASYRFGLVLADGKGGAAIARATREVPIASRRIRADVVAAAGPLLRGEAAGTGVLRLQTEDPGAEVRIDDKLAGRTPLEAKLPAGKHKVEVTQRGKVRVEPFWVDVPANGQTEQRVRLFDIPATQRRPGEVETVVEGIGKDKKKKR